MDEHRWRSGAAAQRSTSLANEAAERTTFLGVLGSATERVKRAVSENLSGPVGESCAAAHRPRAGPSRSCAVGPRVSREHGPRVPREHNPRVPREHNPRVPRDHETLRDLGAPDRSPRGRSLSAEAEAVPHPGQKVWHCRPPRARVKRPQTDARARLGDACPSAIRSGLRRRGALPPRRARGFVRPQFLEHSHSKVGR
jgi:hypothetical protein